MPRSTIEMKALIKTERQERFRERSQLSNKKVERKEKGKKKGKDLDRIKLTVNPLVRFFVLPKIS